MSAGRCIGSQNEDCGVACCDVGVALMGSIDFSLLYAICCSLGCLVTECGFSSHCVVHVVHYAVSHLVAQCFDLLTGWYLEGMQDVLYPFIE